MVFLVGASVKSTLHLYWPASVPLTLCTLKIAGKASGRNCARGPNHFSSDHTSEVARDKPPPPLLINSGFPTSILKRKVKRYSLSLMLHMSVPKYRYKICIHDYKILELLMSKILIKCVLWVKPTVKPYNDFSTVN